MSKSNYITKKYLTSEIASQIINMPGYEQFKDDCNTLCDAILRYTGKSRDKIRSVGLSEAIQKALPGTNLELASSVEEEKNNQNYKADKSAAEDFRALDNGLEFEIIRKSANKTIHHTDRQGKKISQDKLLNEIALYKRVDDFAMHLEMDNDFPINLAHLRIKDLNRSFGGGLERF